MLGDILGVEQGEAAGDQAGDEMDQRHLRGIACAVEHALAEERAAEVDAVKPADQGIVLPHLHAVAMAEAGEPGIEGADAAVDPGVVAAGFRLGAAVDHLAERLVDGDRETVRAHGAGQPGGDFQAVERDDAALFRLDPEQGRIVGAFRHRKDAAGIGAQQHLRRDLGLHGVT